MRVRPYKNVDNRVDGAVLTLVDISVAKRYQTRLDVEVARDQLAAAVAVAREPTFVVDERLVVKLVNRPLADLLGVDDNPAGTPLTEFGRGQWTIAGSTEALFAGLATEQAVVSATTALKDASGRKRDGPPARTPGWFRRHHLLDYRRSQGR